MLELEGDSAGAAGKEISGRKSNLDKLGERSQDAWKKMEAMYEAQLKEAELERNRLAKQNQVLESKLKNAAKTCRAIKLQRGFIAALSRVIGMIVSEDMVLERVRTIVEEAIFQVCGDGAPMEVYDDCFGFDVWEHEEMLAVSICSELLKGLRNEANAQLEEDDDEEFMHEEVEMTTAKRMRFEIPENPNDLNIEITENKENRPKPNGCVQDQAGPRDGNGKVMAKMDHSGDNDVGNKDAEQEPEVIPKVEQVDVDPSTNASNIGGIDEDVDAEEPSNLVKVEASEEEAIDSGVVKPEELDSAQDQDHVNDEENEDIGNSSDSDARRVHGQGSPPPALVSRKTGRPRCTLCTKSFKNEYILRTHYGTHLAKTNMCPKCKKMFTDVGFQNHQRGTRCAPSSVMRHCCPKCGKEFIQLGNLQTHLTTTHSKVREYPCPICSKGFKTRGTMESHHVKVHIKGGRQGRRPRGQAGEASVKELKEK